MILTSISWFFCFEGFAIFPIDFYIPDNSNQLYILQQLWFLIYNCSFFMTWFIIPIVYYYEYSGALSVNQKIK